MKKTDRKKWWKIAAYIVCIFTVFVGGIPVNASNLDGSSDNYKMESRSSSEKSYQRADINASDLSGTYVIANVQNGESHYAAVSSRLEAQDNFGYCLAADNIENCFINGKEKILAAGLTEWTFEKVENNNESNDLYYISTEVNGVKTYLGLSQRYSGIEFNNLPLRVKVLSDGRITISRDDYENVKFVWHGGSNRSDGFFGNINNAPGMNAPVDDTYFTLYESKITYQKAKDIVKNKDLSGTYVIANVENDINHFAAMSSRIESNRLAADNIENNLKSDNEYIVHENLTEWTFERVEKNSYYISTKVNGQTKYLKLSKAAVKNEFNIELVNAKTVVNVEVNSDGRISITNPENKKSRLDWYGGSTRKKTVFGGWSHNDPSDNNYFTLYTRGKTYQKVTDITQKTDLSGTYVIANVENARKYYVALASRQISKNIEPDKIQEQLTESKKYITAAELTEWTFEKAGSDDYLYYVSTTVNGETKYLTISQRADKGEVDIVLTSEKTAVKVFVHSDRGNRISISNMDNKNCKLDWFGGEKTQDYDVFGGWCKDWLNDNNCHTLYRIGTEYDPVLYYDVNIPTESLMGIKLRNGYGEGIWKEQDLISQLADEQFVSYEEESLSWLETPEDGYYTYEKKSKHQSQQIINMLNAENKSSGKDFTFNGWSVTVDDEEYLFDQTAKVSVENNKIKIADGEKTVSVPYGTKLIGKWTQISDIIAFYINENGSVLDMEGDVERRGVDQFTNALAVGRVYFTDEIISDSHEIVGKEDTYGKDADEVICSFIDKTTEKINIVLEYVIDEEGNFKAIDEYQAKNLEEDILGYFKNKQIDITICSPFTNEDIHLNPENCNTDHYGTRWYVLKEDISDFVHIDGVLEAKTVQMKIIKTFYGLDEATIDSLESDFYISSEIRDNKLRSFLSYAYLHTNSEDNTVYSYQREGDSFIWNANLLKGEVYNFKENNYKAEACVVTSLEIVNRDGTKRTVRLGENESLTGIDTSVVEEIHFRNHYGSATLVIVKTDEKNPNKKLENAEFTLTPEGATDSSAVVGVSDADGVVYFDDLELDMTYLLKETKAPAGYRKTKNTWTVKVLLQEISEDDGAVKESIVVKIFDNSKNGDEGTICWSEDEIVEYQIGNTLKKRVKKDSEQPPENKPADDKKPTAEQKQTENNGGLVLTGDFAKPIFMCVLLGLSIVVMCVIRSFKRKEK